MTVKVLGSGCKKCNDLEKNTKAALQTMGITAEIEHVTDFKEIVAFGVMVTPALVINDKVVSSGKVLREKEIVEILGKTV